MIENILTAFHEHDFEELERLVPLDLLTLLKEAPDDFTDDNLISMIKSFSPDLIEEPISNSKALDQSTHFKSDVRELEVKINDLQATIADLIERLSIEPTPTPRAGETPPPPPYEGPDGDQ